MVEESMTKAWRGVTRSDGSQAPWEATIEPLRRLASPRAPEPAQNRSVANVPSTSCMPCAGLRGTVRSCAGKRRLSCAGRRGGLRRAAVAIVSACALAGLSGCGLVTTSVQDAIAQQREALVPAITQGLKHEGTLTVGIRATASPPFVVESQEAVAGLDVELGAALANELGLPVSLRQVDDVQGALATDCDVVMEVLASEANGFDVGSDYTDSAIAFFHRGGVEVLSVDQLANATVALQEGSTSQQALDATALTVQEMPLSTINEAYGAVEDGSADLALGHVTSLAYLSSRGEGVSFAGSLTEPAGVGIAVGSGDEGLVSAVRDAFGRLSQNGVLDGIRHRWLGSLPLLAAESQITGIPMLKAELPPTYEGGLGGLEEVALLGSDGSEAGSNAVILTVADAY